MKYNNRWLITLPHAGGSSTIFKGWSKELNCNVLNIEYPGHWTRMNEPLLNSFEELTADVMNSIQNDITPFSDIYLFGHSLGAILAWWITPLLQKQGYSVKYIFLSSSQSPDFFPERSILDANTDVEKFKFIDYDMKKYPESINNQFIKTFFPIIDMDLQICKSFVSDCHYVDVDAFVLYGKQDSLIDLDKVKTWNNYVNIISEYEFSGKHLYLEEKHNRELLLNIINTKLKESNCQIVIK